jgi:hypothetical protein
VARLPQAQAWASPHGQHTRGHSKLHCSMPWHVWHVCRPLMYGHLGIRSMIKGGRTMVLLVVSLLVKSLQCVLRPCGKTAGDQSEPYPYLTWIQLPNLCSFPVRGASWCHGSAAGQDPARSWLSCMTRMCPTAGHPKHDTGQRIMSSASQHNDCLLVLTMYKCSNC